MVKEHSEGWGMNVGGEKLEEKILELGNDCTAELPKYV